MATILGEAMQAYKEGFWECVLNTSCSPTASILRIRFSLYELGSSS